MIRPLTYITPATSVILGIIGLVLGGAFVWLGFASFFAYALLDVLLPKDFAFAPCRYPRVVDALVYLQLPLLVMLWGVLLYFLRQGSWTFMEIVGATISCGYLFGFAALPSAHELVHRKDLMSRVWGMLTIGFVVPPHVLVSHTNYHHNNLCVPGDAETAIRGQTLYQYMPLMGLRRWTESYALIEKRMRRRGISPWSWRSPILRSTVGFLAMWAVTWMVAGTVGLLAIIGAAIFGLVVLSAMTFQEHYGLVRVPRTPIRAHHAWNNPQTISRGYTFEIATHSPHHVDDTLPFFELRPDPRAPQMPSLFVAMMICFIPPLFERMARPRLAEWDRSLANEEERRLAAAANLSAGWSAADA